MPLKSKAFFFQKKRFFRKNRGFFWRGFFWGRGTFRVVPSPNRGTQHLEHRTWPGFQTQVCSKPNPGKKIWRCDEIVTFVPSSRKIVTFLEVLKILFRNLAASHWTWNVTLCDENVTWLIFVPVTHSKPGRGSGNFPFFLSFSGFEDPT